jgi:hypothetical protein
MESQHVISSTEQSFSFGIRSTPQFPTQSSPFSPRPPSGSAYPALNTDTPESKIISIYPQRDVVLGLANDSGEVQLLVSSFILSSVSTVFAEMLAIKREGSLLNTEVTATRPAIGLTGDDDAEALTVLCKVVRLCSDAASLRPSIDCIEKPAILAEKYRCVEALSFASAAWLQSAIDALPTGNFIRWDELSRLLYAAYVLDCPSASPGRSSTPKKGHSST